jgi:exopolysaccharide production protein ExoY
MLRCIIEAGEDMKWGGRAINRDPGSVFSDSAGIVRAPRASSPRVAAPETGGDRRMRLFDMILATIMFVLILPVMGLIALAIKCTSKGPVIFSHDRIGRGGRMFPCLKFRTMALDADDHLTALLASDPAKGTEWALSHKLHKDPRVTPLGAFLRKTSLDELPQLFNVLHGDMSLVGPRPIVPAEIYRYSRYFNHYCAVRPGITGLWQINGRNNVSYPRRVALDVLYIRSRSLPLNLYILGKTLPCVILANGTY